MKNLKIQLFVIFVTMSLWACKESKSSLQGIEGVQLPITDSIHGSEEIEAFVAPYRDRLNQVLDSTLSYAPYVISKNDGVLNSTAGNLMADIVLSEANPIFEARTGKKISFSVLNHGGIRSVISKGDVSARTAYEIMPFDNSIVVVEMSGKGVRDLIAHLVASQRAHPIAGIQIVIDNNRNLQSVTIQGVPFNENQVYYVATSSYLVSGGDDMVFFKDGQSFTETNYLLRNAIIDYFKKTDTLTPVVDKRFTMLP